MKGGLRLVDIHGGLLPFLSVLCLQAHPRSLGQGHLLCVLSLFLAETDLAFYRVGWSLSGCVSLSTQTNPLSLIPHLQHGDDQNASWDKIMAARH